MPVKDYYTILGLAPGATETEIKRSFRKLALTYHPDKTGNNKFATAWYQELQEAYEVLTDPQKKEAYWQEKWLLQSQGRSMMKVTPLTPQAVLAASKTVLDFVNASDHFRMNHFEYSGLLMEVLNDQKIDMLEAFKDPQTNQKILDNLLKAAIPLKYPVLLSFYNRAQRLALCTSTIAQHQLQEHIRRKQLNNWFEKNEWWMIACAALLLCGLMVGLSIYLPSQ